MLSLILLLVVLIPLMAIVLDSQVGRALASRLERRGGVDGPRDLMVERMAFLEGEVERLNAEVTRLDEESQFLHKLLVDRPAGEGGALPPAEPRS